MFNSFPPLRSRYIVMGGAGAREGGWRICGCVGTGGHGLKVPICLVDDDEMLVGKFGLHAPLGKEPFLEVPPSAKVRSQASIRHTNPSLLSTSAPQSASTHEMALRYNLNSASNHSNQPITKTTCGNEVKLCNIKP